MLSLQGADLGSGWRIGNFIPRSYASTGGNFSVGYFADHLGGKRGFLKILDFYNPLQSSKDPVRELQFLTEAFNYENNILVKCRQGKLDRVAYSLHSGTIYIDMGGLFTNFPVPFLIFEMADGDIRSLIANSSVERVVLLRSMHQAAVAIMQLHRNSISHQDIKPSNLLLFNESGGKIGDLGRAIDKNQRSPYDSFPYAGDLGYAPPEYHYGHFSTDWQMQRMGTDLFQLGNLICFMATGMNISGELNHRLPDGLKYGTYTGTYRDVLPPLIHVFDGIISNIQKAVNNELLPEKSSILLTKLVKSLTHPDIDIRGRIEGYSGKLPQFSLDRHVSMLNRLALEAQYGILE